MNSTAKQTAAVLRTNLELLLHVHKHKGPEAMEQEAEKLFAATQETNASQPKGVGLGTAADIFRFLTNVQGILHSAAVHCSIDDGAKAEQYQRDARRLAGELWAAYGAPVEALQPPPPPVDLIKGPDARYCLDCKQTSLPQRTTCYFCNSARLVPAIKTPCPCCGISQLKPRY